MNGKFVCILAIFAVVAAMTFYEVDACRRCGCNPCQQSSYIAVPAPAPMPVPMPSFPACHSCGGQCHAPSYLPRPYCGGCLRRKTIRLNTNCDCGCSC